MGRPRCRSPLELGEDRGEERRALDLAAELDADRGRRLRGVGRQLVGGLVDVHADAEHDAAGACLGQDADELPARDDDVVRVAGASRRFRSRRAARGRPPRRPRARARARAASAPAGEAGRTSGSSGPACPPSRGRAARGPGSGGRSRPSFLPGRPRRSAAASTRRSRRSGTAFRAARAAGAARAPGSGPTRRD